MGGWEGGSGGGRASWLQRFRSGESKQLWLRLCWDSCRPGAPPPGRSCDPLPLARPQALGITNQRETTVLWSRSTGKPLHNAIVWLDNRTRWGPGWGGTGVLGGGSGRPAEPSLAPIILPAISPPALPPALTLAALQ
jgi:hypothetical protein